MATLLSLSHSLPLFPTGVPLNTSGFVSRFNDFYFIFPVAAQFIPQTNYDKYVSNQMRTRLRKLQKIIALYVQLPPGCFLSVSFDLNLLLFYSDVSTQF